jgi:HB1, ASXL, restriction endonuclease HTH domain
MSFPNAASAILKELGREMTATEVAEIALQRGLVQSRGKTPGATLAAPLYVHVRDHPEGPIRKVAEPCWGPPGLLRRERCPPTRIPAWSRPRTGHGSPY